jgi:hypothetical protein
VWRDLAQLWLRVALSNSFVVRPRCQDIAAQCCTARCVHLPSDCVRHSAVPRGVSTCPVTVSGQFSDTKCENLAGSPVGLPTLSACWPYRLSAHIGARCWLLPSVRCLWHLNWNSASDALCDAPHRLQQGVLCFKAVMPLHSTRSFIFSHKSSLRFSLSRFSRKSRDQQH